MRAEEGAIVISVQEAELLLKALSGAPLEDEQQRALYAIRERLTLRIARHEKIRIMRERDPQFAKLERSV